jgi:ribosomal protein L11 methyltransferase
MLRDLKLRVDASDVEALTDALLGAGALSVAVEDAEAGTAEEQPLYGEPGGERGPAAWPKNTLSVLIEAGHDPQQLLARACAEAGLDTLPALDAIVPVEDADWVRLTQSQFPPTQIAADLWIVPSWHEPPAPRAINIRLDPGVAFGTGSHPTTRLCLRWLAQHRPRGLRVLDYGCGSGVLAIAAARLGAREVIGTDIDPQAIDSARANSAANRVSARYTSPDHLPGGSFDVVLANILANPLRLLAPALTARVAAGGALVLAGILERQADELLSVYRAADTALALQVWDLDEGWVCLAGHRR